MGRVVQVASPPAGSLAVLREAASTCTACPLYKAATQTVFGEGRAASRLVIVGEQPGDAEDLAGRPFVGPAGKLLDEALLAAGVPRAQVYVTNAVKHFKFTVSERPERGKRRLHAKPNAGEIRACKPWLEAELERIEPDILVLLGATAAQAVLGASFRVSTQRGQVMRSPHAAQTLATLHPAAILRMPDAARRAEARQDFAADFARVGELYRRL